jgi:hypothetical protein
MKTISLTVSTVILSHIQKHFCKWFLFPSSSGKNVSTLTPGPSQSNLHYQVLPLSHHFNTVLPTMSRYLKWYSPSRIVNTKFLFFLTTHIHQMIKVKKQWSYPVKPWYSTTVCSPQFVVLYSEVWYIETPHNGIFVHTRSCSL